MFYDRSSIILNKILRKIIYSSTYTNLNILYILNAGLLIDYSTCKTNLHHQKQSKTKQQQQQKKTDKR